MADLDADADSDTGLPDFSRNNLRHHCCFSALSCRIQPGRHLVDGCISAKRLKQRSRDAGHRDSAPPLQGDLRRSRSLCMP